jgi:uncharacterized protein involved in exopolysaccharide biosynthesis
MATEKEQAQAEFRRLESELRAAQGVLSLYLKTEERDRKRGFDKVGPARSAVTNAKRALDIARDNLGRIG